MFVNILRKSIYLWIVGAILILPACNKEELTVLDVPFEELTASYFVLKESTVEIPKERMAELVMGRRDEEIRLLNDPIFANLKPGDVIMSALDVELEDVLFRKIVDITENGDQLIVATELASLPDAMLEFYFNSQFSEVFSFKSDPYDLSQVPGFELLNVFSTFSVNPSFPLVVTPSFNFTGEINFEIIHPHTAYKYFACNNDEQCFAAIDTTDTNPKNGYYDVVDEFFDYNLDPDLTSNGLYTFSIGNFGIENCDLTIASKVGTGQAVGFGPGDSVEKIEGDIVNEIKSNFNKPSLPEIDVRYIPTGITFWNIVSLNIPVASIMEVEMDAAAFLNLSLNFSKRVNIQLGHINWNRSIPSARPDIKITRNGNPASITEILDSPSLNALLAISGSAKFRGGFGIGGAITIGEGKYAGKSAGALVEVVVYDRINGGAGARFSDILNTNNERNFNVFGQICNDMGIEFDAFLFTDVNFLGIERLLGNVFDIKIKIPKETFGLENLSFKSFLPDYIPGNGICFGFLGCESTEVNALNFGIPDDNSLRIEFEIDNQILAPGSFELTLKIGQTSTKLPGDYLYGEYYEFEITEEVQALKSSLLDGSLKIEILGVGNGCFTVLDDTSYGFYVSCDDSPYEDNNLGFGIDSTNLVDNTVTFFDKSSAKRHCENFLERLASPEILEFELENRPCVNPTGFLIPNSGGIEWSTTNKAFIWIEDQSNGHDMMIVEFDFKAGSGSVKEFKTFKASPSTMGTAICVN